jgi:cytochrome o ubiquinol oxidase operon protein cyoD
MSQPHAHDHHDHDHGDDAYHATLGGYTIGFVLSVILTAIPFWLVMDKVISNSTVTAFVVLGIAVVQIIVHMVFFLHMNPRSENGWTMLALIFTMVLLVILLAGSLWVMKHLNSNMMPAPAHDMAAMHNMSDMP